MAEVPTGLESLPAEIIMHVFDECNDFKEVAELQRSSHHFFTIFEGNSSSILTAMARRIAGDAVELAKEILIYQRHSYRAVPDYPAVKAELEEMQAGGGSIALRITDIQQFQENQKFYARFRKYYGRVAPYMAYTKDGVPKNTLLTERQLDHRLVAPNRDASIEYTVLSDITMLQFYQTWLLIWRFRYQTIVEFSAQGTISPEETGQLHFIAFVMERWRRRGQYIVSDAPARIPRSEGDDDDDDDGDTERLEANTARILNGWRRGSFMGIWYPLKSHKEGIFSRRFLEGAWKAVTERGLKGFMYFKGDEFTPSKGGSHLIYWKMLCHLAITTAEEHDADTGDDDDDDRNDWHEEFLDRKKMFDVDFEKLTTVELIEKYKLE